MKIRNNIKISICIAVKNNKKKLQKCLNSILNQNDATGKNIIETRKQIMQNANGVEVKEQEMPDVRRDLQMQAVQEMREKIRR